jgi:hypothetical protein
MTAAAITNARPQGEIRTGLIDGRAGKNTIKTFRQPKELL